MYNIYLEFSAVEQGRAKFMCEFIVKENNTIIRAHKIICSQSYFNYNRVEFVWQILFNLISFCVKHQYIGKIELVHNVNDLDNLLKTKSQFISARKKSFLKKYVFLITQGYGFKFIYDIDRACEENRAIKIKNISYEQSF